MTRDELLQLLEPAVEALGYELVDVEYRAHRRGALLRLFIDLEGGVSVADCERVSRQVGALLDVEDPLPGSYLLEVSSPGERRVLRTRAHFERFSGQRIKLALHVAREGRRRYTGRLLGVDDDDNLALEVDGATLQLPLSAVERARLVPGG